MRPEQKFPNDNEIAKSASSSIKKLSDKSKPQPYHLFYSSFSTLHIYNSIHARTGRTAARPQMQYVVTHLAMPLVQSVQLIGMYFERARNIFGLCAAHIEPAVMRTYVVDGNGQ